MINIAFIMYREWSYKIFKKLSKDFNNVNFILLYPSNIDFKIKENKKSFKIDPKNNKYLYSILKKNKIDIAMFYGWSWIIKQKILDNFLCLGLHPSKLPSYKGGSPLQHQIIDGQTKSAVTIFKLNNTIDGGDIFDQKKLNLKNSISGIFEQMTQIGYHVTSKLIRKYMNKELLFKKQRKIGKIFKRRYLKQSKFDIKEIKKKTFFYFNNYVRALDDPYPNAFCIIQNSKIKIRLIKKYKKNGKIICLNNKKNIPKEINGEYIELKDSLAKIIKGSIVRKN
jgi:methionyl-tRNA formyltransferase